MLGSAGYEYKLFSEHHPGFDFYLDPSALEKEATERTRTLLQQAIAALDDGVARWAKT